MRTMPNTAEQAAAATIAARLRAIAPADHHADTGTPAGAALADMDAIVACQNIGDEGAIEWALASASEATAEYTADGYEDGEAFDAAIAAIGP